MADCYEQIGENNIRLGNIDIGFKMLYISLEIKIEIHGKNHLNLATTYNNIGGVYKYQGELE